MNRHVPLLSRQKNRLWGWIAVALLSGIWGALPAQTNMTFEAETESPEVVQGNTFSLTFTLKNGEGRGFKAPDFSGFKVLDGPSLMRGMTIVNGSTSTHQQWGYELEAKQTGTFTIASATVSAGSKVMRTQPLTIRVVPARMNSKGSSVPPGASDDLFINAELDRETVYPGQQVTWRVKLYTLVAIEGADIIALPDFQGFYSKEKRRFDTRVQYQVIRGKRFAVKTLHEQAIFPQEVGEMTIGPAKVRASIVQPGAMGAFLGGRPVVLQAPAVQLKVKPLPEPTPAQFTGGVGHYEWEWQQDRDSLSTDDALTLTVSLRGNGDARRFTAPKLELPAGLEGFEPKIKEEEEYENGAEIIHTKVLEYVILPKEPGEYTINPELVSFDPDTNRYRVSAGAKPLTFRVVAGKNYAVNPVIEQTPEAEQPVTASKPGIWEQLSSWPVMIGLSGLILLLLGILLFGRRRKTSKPGVSVSSVRPPDLAKISKERFTLARQLSGSGNARAFYDELFKSLQYYLSARLGLTPAQLTPAMVSAKLVERRVSAGRIQTVMSIWQTCEQALFAGQNQTTQMESVWRQAEETVQGLEQDLRK